MKQTHYAIDTMSGMAPESSQSRRMPSEVGLVEVRAMFFVAILLLWLLHILSPPRQKLYREKWGSAYRH